MHAPTVSVVIPTRDRAEVVVHTLASVLAQRDVDLEVVVVDDGSRDGTAAALEGRDRVRVVRLPVSGGQAAARNRGIEEARGSWVAFLDDDDLWEPSKLSRQVAAAEAAGAGWVYASAVAVRTDAQLLYTSYAPDPARIYDELLRTNPIPAAASNVVARRELLQAVGGFDLTLEHFSDWELWIRLAAAAPAAAVRDVLVSYVRHAGNLHIADVRGAARELEVFVRKVRADTGREPDRGLLEEWLAYGHRNAGRYGAAAMLSFSAARRMRSRRPLRRGVGDLLVLARLRHPSEGTAGPAPAWAVPAWLTAPAATDRS